EEMMSFCKKLIERMPAAKVLFISPHLHHNIITTAEKYGIPPGKLIVKNALRKEVPLWLSLSNYSLFFIKSCYSKMASSPTRHGEIMAMGIPIITNNGVGDVKEIVSKYNAGYVLDDFSETSFNSEVDKMVEGNFFNTSAIRKGAEEFYSLDHAIERYRRVYTKILE